VAGRLVAGHGFGIIMDIVVGVIGAFVGGFIAGMLGVPVTNLLMQVLVAIVGAAILLVILKAIGFGRRTTTY